MNWGNNRERYGFNQGEEEVVKSLMELLEDDQIDRMVHSLVVEVTIKATEKQGTEHEQEQGGTKTKKALKDIMDWVVIKQSKGDQIKKEIEKKKETVIVKKMKEARKQMTLGECWRHSEKKEEM